MRALSASNSPSTRWKNSPKKYKSRLLTVNLMRIADHYFLTTTYIPQLSFNFFQILPLCHERAMEAFGVLQSYEISVLNLNFHVTGDLCCDSNGGKCGQDCLWGSFIGCQLLPLCHHYTGFGPSQKLASWSRCFHIQPWRNLYLGWLYLSGNLFCAI